MKLLTTKKLMTTFASLGSVLVMASAYKTAQMNSADFMQDSEIKFAKRFDSSMVRNVASANKNTPEIFPFVFNAQNRELIAGQWEVVSIRDEKENKVYDISEEDKQLMINLELIGSSLVRVGNDEEMKFDISFMHESGKTITLFRSFNGGYEMINARRVRIVTETYEETVAPSRDEAPANNSDVIVNSLNRNTVLERALFPEKTSEILKNRSVEGELALGEGSIENLSFIIEVNANEVIDFSQAGITLQDGGSFQAEVDGEVISGVLTNNGNNGVQIRFVTGTKLKGAMLSFVTYEEKERIRMKEEEAEMFKEEQLAEEVEVKTEENMIQEQATNEREQLAQEEAMEVEMVSEEQAAEIAQEEGFDW